MSSTWPLVEISRSFGGSVHDEIDRLVRLGLAGVDGAPVEVHVRARHPRVRWVVYATTRCNRRHRCRLRPLSAAQRSSDLTAGIPVPPVAGPLLTGWTARRADLAAELAAHAPSVWERRVAWARDTVGGRTYHLAPTDDGSVLRHTGDARFLVTMQVPARLDRGGGYPRDIAYKKTVPVTVDSWQEEVLHVAAHEARHVWQHLHQRPRSEIDAERWALTVVADARTGGTVGVPTGPS